jgi:hypothetical protein
MSYACGKRYSVCVSCMWWCSNTKSVLLLVSNTHDIILVRTLWQYVLVCTSLYDYTFPVPVFTWYVLVRTVTLSVRTKYPAPVPLFTIPDANDAASLLERNKAIGADFISKHTAAFTTKKKESHEPERPIVTVREKFFSLKQSTAVQEEIQPKAAKSGDSAGGCCTWTAKQTSHPGLIAAWQSVKI